MANKKIAIIGAGLGGTLLAILLANEKHNITLFEKRTIAGIKKDEDGRSINLAISTRGLTAIKAANQRLYDRVIRITRKMIGRCYHKEGAEEKIVWYSNNWNRKNDPEIIYAISRRELNTFLLEECEENKNIEIVDESQIDKFRIRQVLASGEFDYVIGVDGLNSVLREYLNPSSTKHEYGNRYFELKIPPVNGKSALGMGPENDYLHIWPGQSNRASMFAALPNKDNSYNCLLFLPDDDIADTFEKEREEFLKRNFGRTLVGMIDTSHLSLLKRSKLEDVSCEIWHNDKILLMGDAAHAILPFYGQGVNSAFEDCCVFLEQLKGNNAESWETAFQKFTNERKNEMYALRELAKNNNEDMNSGFLTKSINLAIAVKEPSYEYEYLRVTFATHSNCRTGYQDALKQQGLEKVFFDEKIKKEGLDKFDYFNASCKYELEEKIKAIVGMAFKKYKGNKTFLEQSKEIKS